MYEFDGFGKRIETLRKNRGLTQEELATRLGITSQAVSKWENDASYPDITLLPTICTILGTNLNDLFGKVEEPEAEEENVAAKFPRTYNGLQLVLAFKDVACYSDKEVKSADETSVNFQDGSMAELANKRIINKGKGEIKLFTFKKKDAYIPAQEQEPLEFPEDSNTNFIFGKISDLDFNIRHCKFTVEKSDTDQTTVYIDGDSKFVEAIKTEYRGNKLTIKFESNVFDINPLKFLNWKDNKIIVKLAYDELNSLDAKIHSNGEAYVGVDFRNANAAIHGSGKMDLQTFANLNTAIHGSGIFNIKAAKNSNMAIHGSGVMLIGECGSTNIAIHGSGNVSIDKLNENITAATHGSGNVKIGGGEIQSCEFSLHGGGNINAESVTTDKAKIKIHGGGRVIIGRVNRESVEETHGGGRIKILSRGE